MESSPFELEQSLPLCCCLAVIGGILEVAATAVTAVPSVKEAQGKDLKPWLYYLALAGNVGVQLTGSILSHLIAPWFGPVSVVVPFFYASTLLSNMGIFGWLLGLEFFSKIMRVGTFVIVVGVILLPVVGPAIQEDQEINELLSHTHAVIWFGFLLSAMTITGFMVGCIDITNYSMPYRAAILLIARASSISLNLTVSRGFICNPSPVMFVFLLVLKIVSGAIYTYAIVVQSTAVDQARFVPLNTTSIIIANALTGILIWEDYKVIISWYGYGCVFVLLGLGCDLLLSTPVALLTEDNPKFGAPTMLRRASEGGLGYRPYQGSTVSFAQRRSSLPGSSEYHSIKPPRRSSCEMGYRSIINEHDDMDSITESDEDEEDYDEDESGYEGTERSYKEAWRELTIAEMGSGASTIFSFTSAVKSMQQTAHQSYQQGVSAMNKATQQLQSAAANTYHQGVAAAEKASSAFSSGMKGINNDDLLCMSAETLPTSNVKGGGADTVPSFPTPTEET